MTKIGHIAWRELRAYFTSWMAYALIAGWLFIAGLSFFVAIQLSQSSGAFQFAIVFANLVVSFLLIAPLITMRLLTEERTAGTMEMLFTSPLSEWQVALGKFFGAWAFTACMMLLTAHLPFFATHYGSLDTGPVWGSYIALLCMSAAFVAYGLFCSSLTESQVVAGFLTFGGLLISWMIGWLNQPGASPTVSFIAQWSIFTHFSGMLQGAVDTRDLVFFASFTILFLFATVRVLESRRWR
ncbi:MAG TPA: ABC transporter permease [Abditibacteriaceae bacterium]|nr:ABC transporter permease [Abditibacteriaceae bacterium]